MKIFVNLFTWHTNHVSVSPKQHVYPVFTRHKEVTAITVLCLCHGGRMVEGLITWFSY